jgi:FKBP-type peptidyl-prolyl cis-trans isomerase
VKNLTLVVLGIIALALMLCVENIARTEETAQPALAAQVPSTDSQPAVGPVAPAEPSRPTLVTEEARLSYAIGFRIGSDFKRQSVPVSVDIFVQGMRDAVGGAQPLMTDQELNETIGNFQKAQQAKAQEAYKQIAEKSIKEGEAFLAENAKAVGVEVLPSGLQYKVITEGSGQKPTLNDTVKSHYSGRLLNGTEFDSSIKRGMPVDFRLPQLIPGMREALLLMPAGSKWEIYIPAKLGYGPEGREGAIPPNAVLIFQVEVISIEKAPAAAAN